MKQSVITPMKPRPKISSISDSFTTTSTNPFCYLMGDFNAFNTRTDKNKSIKKLA